MKKFLLYLSAILLTTCPLFGQATTQYHRVAVALARSFQGVTAQVIPNAKVTVTATATGLAAIIYSDPGLSSQITPAVVTADNSGNYGYYIPLNYCVTETITSPGQGTQIIPNICSNSSSGSIVQASPQFQLPYYDLSGSQSHVKGDSGITTDGSGNVSSNSLMTKVSPLLDPRAQGSCPADGTTDCLTPFLAAVNTCTSAVSNACKVLIPGGLGGGAGTGVFISDGNSIPAAAGWGMVFEVQGQLLHNGTLVLPDRTVLECDGGYGAGGFAVAGKSCSIALKTKTAGTMGTAVTATGSQTFTPTFSVGAASNFVCNTTRDAGHPECGAMTFAGIQTCSSVTATKVTIAGVTVVQFTSSSCTNSSGDAETARVPIGSLLTVSGCTATDFNVASIPVNGKDWPNGMEQVPTNASYSPTESSTTCTSMSGFDDNTFETEWITNISGSTFTATFAHKHAASDVWGIVNVATQEATFNQHSILGAQIQSGPGAALWTDNAAGFDLEGDSFSATGAISSIPWEDDGTWQGIYKGLGADIVGDRSSCTVPCSAVSYPYGHRTSQDASRNNGASGSLIPAIQGTILGGVKFDTNGMANNAGEGPDFNLNTVTTEQTAHAAIEFDPRYGLGGTPSVIMDHVVLQDDFLGNVQNYLGSTDCCTAVYARITPTSYGANTTGELGKYIDPEYIVWDAAGPAGANPGQTAVLPATGIMLGGNHSSFLGDFVGANAGQAPAGIPYTAQAVNSLSTVLTACGANCSSVPDPLNVAAAALQISSTGVGAGTQATFGSASVSTYPGDWIVAKAMVRAGANMANVAPGNSASGFNALFSVVTSGTDTYYGCQNSGTKCVGGGLFAHQNDPWQPGLMIAQVQTGESTAHTLTFYGYSPANGASSPNQGEQFYNWAWWVIPGPNNPSYDGHTTQADVVKFAQEMTHGYIPSGATAGTLYADPNHPLNLGPLTATTLTASGLGTSTSPVCPNGTGGALTTSGCTGGATLPSGVQGQTPVNNGTGATSYTAQSPTIGVANGGAAITTSYTLLCDSATVSVGIQDRGKWAVIGSGGSVTIPDLAGTGCSGFYGGVQNSTSGSVTVSRQTSDTFNVYGPTQGAPTTGQTSFSLPAGSWATFNPSTSATVYDVRIGTPPASSGTSVSVNGSSVSNPNFNGTTPAAGTNGLNVTYQVSGSSVSSEIVGDGNAAHYLSGTGVYSSPAATFAQQHEFIFSSAGTLSYTHNLGTQYPQYSCITKSGTNFSPTWMTWTDANNMSMTAPSATDVICSFGANTAATATTLPPTCQDSSGSGTAQSCTSTPLITVAANACIAYSTTTANSGTGLTINVNSSGAKSVAVYTNNAWTTTLVGGQIAANKVLLACYDGTDWDVQANVAQQASSAYANIGGSVTWTGCTYSGGVCTVGSAVSSITISAIPTTYSKLVIDITGNVSASSGDTTVQVRFNGDSTAGNYICERAYGVHTTAGAGSCADLSYSGVLMASNLSLSGDLAGGGDLQVLNASGTTNKILVATSFESQDPGAFTFGGVYGGSSAISSMVFTIGGGSNFAANDTLTIHGVN